MNPLLPALEKKIREICPDLFDVMKTKRDLDGIYKITGETQDIQLQHVLRAIDKINSSPFAVDQGGWFWELNEISHLPTGIQWNLSLDLAHQPEETQNWLGGVLNVIK